MSKPIQEQIFKSRLTITYRTNITGTVQQEKLPYRLLVLGEFAGRSLREAGLLPDLAKRSIRTIKRGTTVNDHLRDREVTPMWRIPKDDEALRPLRSAIPGQIHFDKVTVRIPLTALEQDGEKAFSLTGSARFESKATDNGMTDITGEEVRVHGSVTVTIANRTATAKSVKIDLTGAVEGAYEDPSTNKEVMRVTGLLETRGLALDDKRVKVVPADEDDEDAAAAAGDRKVKVFTVQVEGPEPVFAERTIPFRSVDAFSPDEVAASIPEVYRLQVLKKLLLELQSGLRNRPDLRKRLKDMLPGYGEPPAAIEAKLQGFRDLKEWAGESFPLLRIEQTAVAAPAGGGAAPAGGGGAAPAGGGGAAPAGGGGAAPAGGGGAAPAGGGGAAPAGGGATPAGGGGAGGS
ncbi:type VI secretion system contractile sheath small subunit [Sorangium sp. So ce375]|uniref:type VI secretion system contractile sheath small subunit n=1 Tax=Sorangium sp. So ce375 TaxID=3133306 RepID=UPI003F5C06F3